MTWLLVGAVWFALGLLTVMVGRMLRRQNVLIGLIELESDMAAYWSDRLCGFMQMRIDFGDVEALAWLDLDIAMTDGELEALLDRGEQLLDQL